MYIDREKYTDIVLISVKGCFQIKFLDVYTHVTPPWGGNCAVFQQFSSYAVFHTSGEFPRVINEISAHSGLEPIGAIFGGDVAIHNP